MTVETKRCPTCGETKESTAFSRHRRSRDGLQYQCRSCNASHRASHREERAIYQAAYYAAHREDKAAYRDDHRSDMAAYHLSQHGLTPEDFDAVLDEQGGGCGICGTTDPGRDDWHRLSIDHDHSHCPAKHGCPDCIRGILCAPCNTQLERAESHAHTEYLSSPPVALYLGRYAARARAERVA